MSPEPVEMSPEPAEISPDHVGMSPEPFDELRTARVEGRDSVDWVLLRAAARDASRHAYAPYSHFPVGAAALVDDGRVVTGCNVENASYGATLCAECGLVSALHTSGGGRLVAFACVDGAGAVLMPCGRCRQLLWEHGGAECLVDTPSGILPMSAVLPQAFGPADLARRPS
jgi:cytidine deaminase